MKSLTLVSWNLKTPGGASHADVALPQERTKLITAALEARPAIVALQEVTPGFARCIQGVHHSLVLRRPGPFDGGSRMLGVALLTSPDVVVERWELIDRAPFPERTLTAEVRVDDRTIRVVVFHSLTGVGYLRAKAAQFIAIAEHLAETSGDVVLMGDANEPKVDARDPRRVEFWPKNGKGAEYLFGEEAVHDLKDAWRSYLGERVKDLPAEGPLAVSHRTRGNPRRYDHIYIPQSWNVLAMAYRYEVALEAGSDHALVTATVEVG